MPDRLARPLAVFVAFISPVLYVTEHGGLPLGYAFAVVVGVVGTLVVLTIWPLPDDD